MDVDVGGRHDQEYPGAEVHTSHKRRGLGGTLEDTLDRKGYIQLEFDLREFDCVRELYQKYIEVCRMS